LLFRRQSSLHQEIADGRDEPAAPRHDRGMSLVTLCCYVHTVAKFPRHFIRSPDRLGRAEIRAYQIHLTTAGISRRASTSPSVPCPDDHSLALRYTAMRSLSSIRRIRSSVVMA
jgi:hypothetical protein